MVNLPPSPDLQGSNFIRATTANAATSLASVLMPFKFDLYWRHYNAVYFSHLALVSKKALGQKNLLDVFVLPFLFFLLKTQNSRENNPKGGTPNFHLLCHP